MFNLLVSARGWAPTRDASSADRLFEYTAPHVITRFKSDNQVDFAALCQLPTLMLDETNGNPHKPARLVTLIRARYSGREIELEYANDPDAPPLTNGMLETLARDLDITPFEFERTHWAVKDIDLFRVLNRAAAPRRPRARVFRLNEPEHIEPSLVSAMMPFDSRFDAVAATLKEVSENAGLRCRRADDIWDDPAVIQDVVSLIDQSRVVIADCTDRNPNVFYEIGIAHTLGRDVILITQNDGDIPFDLRHLRYVKYLNNGEGLQALAAKLFPRLRELAGED
ncbi:MAG: hypothetical protein KF709_11855 [Gemmatimonadaceae bacterium]|nr:hypothetical protein [Gemmatimonadaceae bacterium]